MNDAQQLLTWSGIWEWAAGHQPGAVLGESCTNSSCPIARYLNEQTGIQWSVGPSIKPADGRKKDRLDKPAWIDSMIRQIDGKSGSLTREQFLSILEQVKEEDRNGK